MKVYLSYLTVMGLARLPTVFGWGAAGHEIVATIAQIHLHPSVFPAMCSILNFTSTDPDAPLCHLAPVATWADNVRYRMRWSAGLHYIGALDDYPSETCVFPGKRGWAGRRGANVLGAIRNVTGILDDWSKEEETSRPMFEENDLVNEALKFLIHFMGDMHMPLHLTGRDRGGNSDKVRFDGRLTNLHSVWDTFLIAKALRSVPRKYNKPLPDDKIEFALRGTIYDSYIRQIMWEGILGEWQDELPDWLSCPASPTQVTTGPWQTVMSLWHNLSGRAPNEFDDDVLCPHYWAQPIHALNCELIWPKALDEPPYNQSRLGVSGSDEHDHGSLIPEEELKSMDSNDLGRGRPQIPYIELDTPEYSGVISQRRIVEKLLATAGIRLAGILNWLFAETSEDMGGDGRLHALQVFNYL